MYTIVTIHILIVFMILLQAYKELQKKFVEDKRKERECSGEYGLYYNPDKLDPDLWEDDTTDDSKHTTPQHR